MKKLTLLAIPLAAGAIFVGCGGDDDSSSDSSAPSTAETKTDDSGSTAPASETLALAADPSGALAYDKPSLSSKAGTVEVDFTNDSSLPHDVVFEQDGNAIGKTSVITGSSESTEIDVQPGKYQFYCSVPGHREGGMEGVLVVK